MFVWKKPRTRHGSFSGCCRHAVSSAHFHQTPGLQLWSLREQGRVDLPAALDLAKSYGFTSVETAGTGNLTVAQFSAQLRARSLNAVSAHVGYDALQNDIVAVVRDAQTLGVKFVVCPSLPHIHSSFKEDDARRVAADFNTFGEACRAGGLRFGYHPHGFEFTPSAAGNGEVVFDVLARATKPELVDFEMDVFWVRHAGQDPVKLLEKYSARWALMHVKDMRKGAPTGFSNGRAPPADNVAVGTGQIDWPVVFVAARKSGVQYYFLEDETVTPLQCIPSSLTYLRTLGLTP
jgi:sugar phosphate isomerase/epimerase